VLAVSFEVISRYAFDAPTIWSFDVTYMLYGTIFMLGAAYALHKGAHIRTDFFYEKWSAQTKGIVDSISYVVFFFPSLIMFFVASGSEAWYAYTISEPPSRRRGGDPVALQGRGAAYLRAAHDPGVSETIRACMLAHRRRARAQGEGRDMTTEILIGLVMLIVMIGAIFIGIQISFTLLFLALAFGYLALGRVVFDLAYFQTIGLMKEELLAAVPLFIFMGYITEQAG